MEEGTVTTQSRARSFIIKRPRLTKILDESEARILLLVAPAGYGKTTLAREWVEGKEGVAWYSAGPSMADVAALAAGIAEAFDPALADRVRLLAANGQSAEALARVIASSEDAQACSILAIDDCHHAAESREAVAFLCELLSRTTFRVVAASRVRPAWATPRMLVYGDAAMLDMSALAFTGAETEEIVGASASASQALKAANGWPAVIGLVARRAQTGAPVQSLEPSDLYEFFAEDLFKAASPQLQSSLFLLALGADATGDVARQLLGVEHDVLVEEAVERGFIAGGDAIKLHPLLRGFLLSKLKEAPGHGTADTVGRVTSALAERGQWDECLTALEVFPEPVLIASILNRALPDLLSAGRTATINHWVALANASGSTSPILLLAEAEMAMREGDTGAALALGERAGELLGSGNTAARAYVVAGRAAHLRDDRGAAQINASKAEEASTSIDTKVESLWVQFTSAIEEATSDAVLAFERMQRVADERPEHALRVHHAKAMLLLEREKSPRAAAEESARGNGLLPHISDPVLRTTFQNLQAHILVTIGEYEAASEVADQQMSDATNSGLDFAVDHGTLVKVGALVGLRRFREAQRLTKQLERRPSARSDYILRNAHLLAARVRIAMGDLERAEILLRQRGGLSTETWTEHVAYRGLVLAALGYTEEASMRLSALREGPLRFDALGALCVADAILHVRRGDVSAAQASLAGVIKRGCIDAAVSGWRAFPNLARCGAQDPELAQALTSILVRSRDMDLARHVGLDVPREFRRYERLTNREAEVYELLIQGRTNQEIAQQLFISISTTKVHVRHIFEKLNVHTRAEAAHANVDQN